MPPPSPDRVRPEALEPPSEWTLESSQLVELQKVSNELSQAKSLDDLCRQAVLLGQTRLGFDRVGIWFKDQEPGFVRGTFGVDESGHIRDERHKRIAVTPDSLIAKLFRGNEPVLVRRNLDLSDLAGFQKGAGTHAVAALVHDGEIIGLVGFDNLLSGAEITAANLQLFSMYATTLGHVCARKKSEETLARNNQRLIALERISRELSLVNSIDEICRKSVELGRAHLGFDRLAIFFREGESSFAHGAFGTSLDGRVQDERALRVRIEPTAPMGKIFSGALSVSVEAETVRLGDGTAIDLPKAMAPLSYGEEIIGCLVADQLWQRAPFTEFDLQALSLFADDIGHLCVRKRIEDRMAQSEARLRQALTAARQANAAKDEFLAMMSHELRTPLNPITGYAGILRDSLTRPEHLDCVDAILESADRQLNLIDRILNFARLDRGSVEPKRAAFSPIALCRHALNDLNPGSRRLELRFENGSDPWEAIPEGAAAHADPNMIRQLLDNLLGNAVKYTNEGTITLTVGLERQPGDRARLHFAVTDTGIGLAPNIREKIFEPFAQADSSFSRRYQGAGLGLAISKKLIDILGGEIGVESEEGAGSQFTFWVPVKALGGDSTEPANGPAHPGQFRFTEPRRILVVDDVLPNLIVTQRIVERFGLEVTTAASGAEAIDACQVERYDAILMDLAMPEIDGFSAAETIRSPGGPNESTPIIAITADVSQGIKEKCAAAGFNGYVSKPFSFQDLFDAIRQTASG